MKNSLIIFLSISLFCFTSCNDDDDYDDNVSKNVNIEETMADVYQMFVPTDQNPIILGNSRMIRDENGVQVIFKTSNLISGNAYTLWFVVINKPELCDGIPCRFNEIVTPTKKVEIEADILYLTGLVAGESVVTFEGYMNKNEGINSANKLMGLPTDVGGLLDVNSAEVHLVLRDHGPAVPNLLFEQTTSFNGGCYITDTNGKSVCNLIQASIHKFD